MSGMRKGDLREYMKPYPLSHPGRAAVHLAAGKIGIAARAYFSGRLLDIGCGTKRKSLLLRGVVADHVGLDHAESPHGLESIDLVGTAYAIPAADGSFDCALSTAVIEHLEEPLAALRETHRVLRPGGVALYTAPLYWHIHEAPRDFFRYTEYGLRHLFGQAGLEIVELQAMSGFWITFGAQVGYYAQRFRSGLLKWPVDAFVALTNLVLPWLDRGRLRDERFTWMYLVVARKPAGVDVPPGSQAPESGGS